MEHRVLAFWVVGSISMFLAVLIASNTALADIGSAPFLVTSSYLISLALVFIAGLFWISIPFVEH